MIRIYIPEDNFVEREYILSVIFGEFLGCQYQVEAFDKTGFYEIILDTGAILKVKDSFFGDSPISLDYLRLSNVPQQVAVAKLSFIPEIDIPIIYGCSEMKISDSIIECGLDIFGSCFFMLTRWEEYVCKERDKHNRFPAAESLAYKFNFLDRPVVNEYVEMLWNMLLHLGVNERRKKRVYNLVLTHDVDVPVYRPRLKNAVKLFVTDVVRKRNFKLAFDNLLDFIKHKNSAINHYDTFDKLMDLSEGVGVKSHFFFMGEGVTAFDNFYKSDEGFVQELIKKIKHRKHSVGIHPTYNAYNDTDQFRKEKDELERNLGVELCTGRQHFLRFEVPKTWQIWEDNNMKWDSTLSYADKEGFRCGVCYEYSVFNFLQRRKLRLKEKPLIVMEGSFITYQPHISPEEMIKKIKGLMKKVKKYDGEFVLLWHNSSFNTGIWRSYQHVYSEVLK